MQAKEIVLRPGVFGGLAGFGELNIHMRKVAKLSISKRRCPLHCRLLQLQALEPHLGPPYRDWCHCRSCRSFWIGGVSYDPLHDSSRKLIV